MLDKNDIATLLSMIAASTFSGKDVEYVASLKAKLHALEKTLPEMN